MKCFLSFLFFTFYFILNSDAQSPESYTELIKEADVFYKNKDYVNAASKYADAFKLVKRIPIDPGYNAASAWALLNNNDSAFSLLDKLAARRDFTYLDDVTNDSNFISLHIDTRWQRILDKIKSNVDKQNEAIELYSFSDSLVYAYGVLETQNLKSKYGRLKPDIISAAARETLRNKAQLDSTAINKLIASANIERKKGEDFLKANKTKPGIITTATGLQYKIINKGTGTAPADTSHITVYYTGKLIDGTVFDSVTEPASPITFPLNRLITGWQQGLKLIKPGGKITLYLPSKLGYGISGAGEDIKPNAVLIFDVELVKVE